MNLQQDILEEYTNKETLKSRLFKLLITLDFALILFVSYIVFDLNDSAFFDSFSIIFLIVIPLVGLVLFALKYRPGWVICTLYRTLFAVFILLTVISSFSEQAGKSTGVFFYIGQSFFLIIAIAVAIIFWTNDIRRYLSVNPLLSIVTLFISIILSIILFVAV